MLLDTSCHLHKSHIFATDLHHAHPVWFECFVSAAAGTIYCTASDIVKEG